jgi:superfamily II DNA or RNA helicase
MPPKRKKSEPMTSPYILNNVVKQNILEASYIGKKGYTIPKSVLPEKELAFLKKDLFLKPQVPGPAFAQAQGETAFPVYRENPNKIYIPRFYGIERYGTPLRNDIEEGEDIAVSFPRTLRDYQENIVDIYNQHISKQETGGGGILEIYCGAGKCLGINTPILMYDGSVKMVQDVVVGDLIMGDDSTPRKVLTLARGREQMYTIRDNDYNEEYTVNESHILSLKSMIDYDNTIRNGTIVDVSVKEYLKFNKKLMLNLKGYRSAVDFPSCVVRIEPYYLGFWLGSNRKINNNRISKFHRVVPTKYKINSKHIRKQVLNGIIDGSREYYGEKTTDKELTFINNVDGYPKFINDILFIARSLGYNAKKEQNNQGVQRICIYTHIDKLKTEENDEESMFELCYNISVIKKRVDRYYGFEIDGNRRFVLGDCTVTHNTVMALKIVEMIQKKTLILVHKEFLMNQWIERIEEFLPGARVGKIQASVCDCEDKDIVIGMIQTMYNKVFPQEVYSQFGLTIIDEVHRIGSEEFSKTLLKTITPYMLGISATVERKDKLTKLLYMFIGPKIHSMLRKQEDIINVRGIEYKTADQEFNTVEYDFRGNTKFSTMISKLSNFGARSDFIVRVVHDLLIENPAGQVMVLCHNRCLLTYLYESIMSKGVYSVGYYVGGMKQVDLEETETKKIVLATYAMAAEALDIKTLSMLVMASPKTDITQSVGRILRMKHDNPVVVDIVDSHDIFQRQWLQRKRFYKKSNYYIRYIRSPDYSGMNIDWENDKSWSMLYDPNNKGKSSKNDTPEIEKGKCMINVGAL